MLNKNDPLIGAVQEVMKKNQAERDAVRLVNEIFGVTDRKALPHERQGEWDAAYKQVLSEGLHPNQQKLDVHEPEKDKLTKHDFKMLRAKKKPMEEENAPKTDPYAEGQASSISTVSQPKKEVTPADQSALKKKIMSIKEANLEEKAVSKAQRRFFGLVSAIKDRRAKGSPEAMRTAKEMPASEIRKFAKTKEKDLPEKISEADDSASSMPQVKHQTQYGTRPSRTIGGGGRTDGSTYTQGRTTPKPIGTGTAPAGGPPPSGTAAPRNVTSTGNPNVAGSNQKKVVPTGNPNMAGSGGNVGASAPKKITPTGNPNMAGSGGNVGASAPKPAVAAAPKTAARPAAAPKAVKGSTSGGLRTQSDANLLARAKAGGGQKLSKTFKSGKDRLAYFAARNRDNK